MNDESLIQCNADLLIIMHAFGLLLLLLSSLCLFVLFLD